MADLARLSDVAMVSLRVRNAAGLPAVGRSQMVGADRIVALGPDEWLAIGPDHDAAALLARLAPHGGITVDVSGNRVVYRIAGPHARWLLAAGTAFDCDRIGPDDAVSTLFARAQVVLIAETADAFLILPRRSFAAYLEDWVASVDA